jgi:hypothetical protein
MQTYKAQQDQFTYFNNFLDLQAAKTYYDSVLIGDYDLSLASDSEQILPITSEQKLKLDKEFGNYLIDLFLLDNRLITPVITSIESLQLLNQFEVIEKLANLGDIKSVNVLLQNIQTDIRLFTQDRKQKYLELIQNYINSYG